MLGEQDKVVAYSSPTSPIAHHAPKLPLADPFPPGKSPNNPPQRQAIDVSAIQRFCLNEGEKLPEEPTPFMVQCS